MRCTSICSANAYHIDELAKHLRTQAYEPKFYDDIIHIEQVDEEREFRGDAFFFPYGCIVTWGLNDDEDDQLVDLVKSFQKKPTDEVFKDVSYYTISPSPTDDAFIDEENDEMILPTEDILIKLSFSHALSQSVKLSSFEHSISKTIDKTRNLPEELATKGHIPLSRRKLAKLMGELFAQRDSMNLDSDILDTPEFFWRRPKYEPFYLMGSNYLDIQARVAILNRKLDRVHEQYDILSNEHKHLHSTRLEVVVIILIMIEVLFTIFREWGAISEWVAKLF
jgi:uncharacterized Rmd1/YagE family protein